MYRILEYTVRDILRSRWTIIYFVFYLTISSSLFLLSGDGSKVMISLLNIVLVLVPLIATIFGVMYYYNAREFIELLLAKPVKRTHIFVGQYLGLSISLSLSFILGLGLPFLITGAFQSTENDTFFTLLLAGTALTFIFCALSFLFGLKNNNKLKGFGIAILFWLFWAIVYDGLLLFGLAVFGDYPIENAAIGAAMLNPIDLSRIIVLLKLDISALMGYTGAVFQKFLGSWLGSGLAFAALLLWILLPVLSIRLVSVKKDF